MIFKRCKKRKFDYLINIQAFVKGEMQLKALKLNLTLNKNFSIDDQLHTFVNT